ncbi:MAG: DinB family protein [Xanthomonadales bacterium]|nr:DinB family protein [Xanthomonadales bacterium]
MKPTSTIAHLFGHNLWANLRLIDACAALNPEQLNTKPPGVFASIRDSLEHVVRSEESYFSLISTGQRPHRPEEPPPMTIEEMKESAITTGRGLLALAPSIDIVDSVQIDWGGPIREVPKMVILTQVINHATEHRAEVITILIQLGIQPPALDSWTYFDQGTVQV